MWSADSAVTFTGGGLLDDASGMTASVALTQLDNRQLEVATTMVQGASPVFVKKVFIETADDASFLVNFRRYGAESLIDDGDYYSVASTSPVHKRVITLKKGQVSYVRARIVPYKATITTNTAKHKVTAGVSTSMAADPSGGDSTTPGAPGSPTIEEAYGEIWVVPPDPTTIANNTTFKCFVFRMWDSVGTTLIKGPKFGAGPVRFRRRTDTSALVRLSIAAKNSLGEGVESTRVLHTPSHRPNDDVHDQSSPPFLPAAPGGKVGYSNAQATVLTGNVTPMYIWNDTDGSGNGDVVVEFTLPSSGVAAYSSIAIEFEMYNTTTGALKLTDRINPATTQTFRRTKTATRFSFRYRYRTKYRGGGHSGWSGFSEFAKGYSTADTTNDYAGSVTDDSDFYDPSQYPSVYTTY
jgi:hypothetical protein